MTNQLGAPKHRVIYTKSGTKLSAARFDSPHPLVENSLYWLPAGGLNEARYLTAILNAQATTERVSAYQSRGLFGARHFDKYVWLLPIPKFDPRNELHLELVGLAEQAEVIAAGVDVADYGFQKVRGLIRTKLEEAGINEQLDRAVNQLLDGTD